MVVDSIVTPTDLKNKYRYCEKTGQIFYRSNDKVAGYVDKYGYRQISIMGKRVAAHRVVWCMLHGDWPQKIVDHVNGNRDDNRIDNLRLATARENCHNRLPSRGAKSKYKGVDWHRCVGKWRARIKTETGTLHLGHFETEESAREAYLLAEPYFFGSFAKGC